MITKFKKNMINMLSNRMIHRLTLKKLQKNGINLRI